MARQTVTGRDVERVRLLLHYVGRTVRLEVSTRATYDAEPTVLAGRLVYIAERAGDITYDLVIQHRSRLTSTVALGRVLSVEGVTA
ncbi:MAG: hypothetical protein ACRD2Z_09410 [Thermoanaerobaculia bacterium]